MIYIAPISLKESGRAV